MVEIKHSLLRQDRYDSGSPARVIINRVTFPGFERQIGCRDDLNFCLVVGANPFFRRERKWFDLSRVHTYQPLLDPRRDNMLALGELLGISVLM